jgi:hypothetical protein
MGQTQGREQVQAQMPAQGYERMGRGSRQEKGSEMAMTAKLRELVRRAGKLGTGD